MTSFGWKRKVTDKVASEKPAAFDDNVEESERASDNLFLALAKKRKLCVLEDCISKSTRLVKEGVTLAEAERYWEAIKKWDEAIQLTPGNSEIYEMKAQALMELSEVFPATQSAEKAVSLDPLWWVAHQTLARAQLGLGEVELAKRTIIRAIHLNPSERELWEDDLRWICSLCDQKKTMKQERKDENG